MTIHFLILTSITMAIFTFVMAYGWVGSVDRRLSALEGRNSSSEDTTDGE